MRAVLARWIDGIWRDVRYAGRSLFRRPGFTIVILLTLGLGIGATTAVVSVVDPILVDQLPYPQAARIIAITDEGNDRSRIDVTFGTYRELLSRSRSLETAAVMKPWQPTIVGAGEPERLEGQRVSASYFQVLGIPPRIGRDLGEAEDRPNGPNVVVIGEGLWRRRFAADTSIIGRAITLDHTSFTVIGVMPREFENVAAPEAEAWAPLQYDQSLPPDGREWGHHLRMIARLRSGVDLDRARHELNAIAGIRDPAFVRPPWARLPNGLLAVPLQDDVTSEVRPALLAVSAAVLLLLLSACVNVAGLQLARNAARRGEFAMRAALGAGRRQLVQQLVVESSLLALGAGALGLLLAHWTVPAVLALSPVGLPRSTAVVLDARVFAVGFALAAAAGFATSLLPALLAPRRGVMGLQHASVRVMSRHQTSRRLLVVVEIGLAVVLLIGAGLLLNSVRRLLSIPPGFEPARLVAMQVQAAGGRFERPEDAGRFFGDALEAVRALPGVEAAGFTSQLPLSGSNDMFGVHRESGAAGQTDADRGAFRYAVTAGYLEAMGIALRQGRFVDAHDTTNALNAVLVSESLARSRFGGIDAIGQRLRIGPTDAPLRTIVGIVGNVRQRSLGESLSDAVYVPNTQWILSADRAMWLVVRGKGDARALIPAVKAAIWSVDKDQPIVRIATMDELLARSDAVRSFASILFEVFAALALVLAAIGVYGLLAGHVAERTREIGVRMALGATRAQVMRFVLNQSLALTAVGMALGLAGAAATTRYLQSLLFGVTPLDPLTFAGVAALVAVVATFAAYVPARRAAGVDPLVALHCE
jgi:putative ABC transport system permease protein